MISCIIPCFNEEKRIEKILYSLLTLSIDIEYICIDDGSNDKTFDLLSKIKDKRLKIIKNHENVWKYKSLLSGINLSQWNTLIFLDADLINFEVESILKGIEIFERNNLDMLIFRRKNTLFRLELFWLDILLSWERILRKNKFLDFFHKYEIKPFEIELALGKYCLDNNLKVWWMYSLRENTFKFQKRWYVQWFIDDIKMYKDIWLLKNEWYKQYYAIKNSQYIIYSFDWKKN